MKVTAGGKDTVGDMQRVVQSIPSSYTVWKDGTQAIAESNVKGGTDYTTGTDAVVIQNAIDAVAALGGGKILIRQGIYDITAALAITTDGIIVEGEGSNRKQVYYGSAPSPLARITGGTVLKVTTAAINCFEVSGHIFGLAIRHLAIDFTQAATGHAITCSVTNTVGISEFCFEDIFVNNTDGGHYALRMENAALGTVTGLTSFGGPLLELVSEPTAIGVFYCGNVVYTEVTGWICKTLSNHAVYVHRNGGTGYVNLNEFNRLFVILDPAGSMSTFGALWCEYMFHSLFNMLNIEVWGYGAPTDSVHLAEVHDTTFINPYVMYFLNNCWMAWTDCDNIRVFGGNLDVDVADRTVKDTWFGVGISHINVNHLAKLERCFVWDLVSSSWLPTENNGTSTGTGAQQEIDHGCGFTPTTANVILTDLESGAAAYCSAAPTSEHIYVTATNNQDYRWEVKYS